MTTTEATHTVTVVEHGANSRLLFLTCNDCPWEVTKPVGWVKAQRLAALHGTTTWTRDS